MTGWRAAPGPLYVATVRGESMEPALRRGDRLLVVGRWPHRLLRRGHIVVVREFVSRPYAVKRVVGLPGDAIAVRRVGSAEPGQPLVVPNRTVFVRGDAPASQGSDEVGPVPWDHLEGVVLLRLRSGRVPAGPAGSGQPSTAS